MEFHFPPQLKSLKRGPQLILPKDLGLIVAYTGMNKESIVADAGAGSGFSSIFFASIAKKVYSFETRDEFIALSKENIRKAKVENIELIKGSIFDKISEIDEEIDIINLDLPTPELIFDCKFSLRDNGYIVACLPNIEQVIKFVKKARENKFETFTIENVVREILVREEGTRPQTKGLLHTLYLTFCKR